MFRTRTRSLYDRDRKRNLVGSVGTINGLDSMSLIHWQRTIIIKISSLVRIQYVSRTEVATILIHIFILKHYRTACSNNWIVIEFRFIFILIFNFTIKDIVVYAYPTDVLLLLLLFFSVIACVGASPAAHRLPLRGHGGRRWPAGTNVVIIYTRIVYVNT